MKSKRTQQFYELYEALPTGVQKQADKAYEQFEINPDHPGLNFKPVSGDPVWYSARIGIKYRAVCLIDGDVYVWFWIGIHTEYEKLLNQH